MKNFADFLLFEKLDFEFNYFIVSENVTRNYKVSGFEIKKNNLSDFERNFLKFVRI